MDDVAEGQRRNKYIVMLANKKGLSSVAAAVKKLRKAGQWRTATTAVAVEKSCVER